MPNNVPAGELRFVTYQNLGALGPGQNEAGRLDWRPAARYSLWPLWALVALLWVIPGVNRRRGALNILIPLVVLGVAGWGLDRLSSLIDDAGASDVLSFVGFFCVGWGLLSCALWLAAPWLTNPWLTNPWLAQESVAGAPRSTSRLPGSGRWSASARILAAVGLAAGVQAVWMWGDAVHVAAWLGCVAVATLLTLIPSMLAGYNCRQAYYADRFTMLAFGWFAALLAALAVVIATVTAGVLASAGVAGHEIAQAVFAVALLTLVAAVFLLLVNFPVWIMAVASGFYRERLKSLLQMDAESSVPTGVAFAGNSPFGAR